MIQDRTEALQVRAEEAVVALSREVGRAKSAGVTNEQLKAARDLHRKAEWRLDYVAAENLMGFHALRKRRASWLKQSTMPGKGRLQ